MKYIRTKDGRILNYEKLNEISKLSISMDAMEKNCDFKIGDTIEELVDCYSYETETTTDLGIALGWKFANQSRHIYGCIKTNIGLIYVAKMNDKGELELL